MLWFYNIKLTNNNPIIFYQVFVENNLVYTDDSNIIYSFNSTELSKSNLNINLNNCVEDKFECDIKMIDHIISYDILSANSGSNTNINDNGNNNFVFMTKSDFIKPEENKLNLPIFTHTYKLTSTKKLPNLIESAYDHVYKLFFQIYKLDKENKIQFIIETNPITNSTRKYFVSVNLDLIKTFISNDLK